VSNSIYNEDLARHAFETYEASIYRNHPGTDMKWGELTPLAKESWSLAATAAVQFEWEQRKP
jgi:hypothetical protein